MGIRSVIGWVVSAVGSFYGQGWAVAVGQGMIARDNYLEQKKAKRRALQDYNNSLQDRLEMLDLQPNYPRTLVLGRVRYVEGVRRRWTSGANEEKLTMIVSFAGHEIDAFEQWYLDDKPVTLDANGYVQEAPYYRGDHAEPTTSINDILISELGEAAVVLSPPPAPTSNIVCAWVLGTGDEATRGTATVVVGTIGPDPAAYISGAPPGAMASVVYSSTSQLGQYVRIRPYLGTAGQNVGAALAAEYPGKITSADKFAGIALAVVDVYYSPDVFPQGRPNITAVMRGAKCYDPRTTLTVWTENPALHALHYATWAHGWALQAADYRAADIVAAANVCDVSTVFTLRDSGGGTSTATLPRYRSGITIAANADHAETMDAIMVAMAGQHGWAGGVWRMRAGTMATPVASITQDWLMVATSAGQRSDDPVITAVQTVPRVRRVNRVAGSCVDPAQRYQLLPFPAVEDAVLIAAEGERQADVELQAVNHIAHAQHLASIAIRQAQAGLRLELLCGEQAATLELLDVVQVTMPRYGFTAKTFEVVGWTWSQAAAYKVQLAEITADIFTPLAELTGRDPAPDSDIRAPWDVEAITGVAVTSGTAALTDGSIITRTRVDWTPATGASVRTGGQIEVQYAEANALPDGDWPSWLEAGDAGYATLPGLMAGRVYVFRVRAVQTLPLVRGAWSTVVMHQVADVPVVAGGAGQYKAFIFKRAATAPATPTGTTPAGWFDSPPAADGNPLWTSVADKEADGTLIGTWSAPVQIEGAGIEVEYSVNGTTLWHSTFTLGDLYARHRVKGAVTWDGPWRIVGEDGTPGVDGVVWSVTAEPSAITRTKTNTFVPNAIVFRIYSNAGGDGPALDSAYYSFYKGTGTTSYTWGSAITGSGTQYNGQSDLGVSLSGTHTALKFEAYADAGRTQLLDSIIVPILLEGTDAISATMSNEAHVFPASTTGAVSSYTGSGTELRVYEGANALTYDGVGTANGTWTFSTATTNITRGAITDSGTFATIGQHSGVADGTDTASIVYTITGKTAAGASITMTKSQTFAKSKTGSTGATGSTGSTGSTGQSNHRVYKAVTIGAPPATPGTTTSGATPATWSATPLTLSTGQEQYQSDGTTPAGSTTTTWGTPYPSYLKVGNLAAISADLGTVTAGNVSTSGYVKVEGSTSISVPFLSGTASMAVALAGNTAAGATSGVYGRSSNISGAGVLGINTNTTSGDGVYGEGKQGVTGLANSANGSGVFGYGAFAANSVGVEALANNTVSGTRAMQATADAAGQTAIKAISASGIALDVVGTAQVSGLCTLADLRINKAPTTGAVAAGFTAIVSNKPAGSVAGSEAKWLALNLNGTTYYVPVWT